MSGGRKDLSIGIGVINGIITIHYHSISIYVEALGLGMNEQIQLHYTNSVIIQRSHR